MLFIIKVEDNKITDKPVTKIRFTLCKFSFWLILKDIFLKNIRQIKNIEKLIEYLI